MAGLIEQVSVIEECNCFPKTRPCQRINLNVVHFPGTPFETVGATLKLTVLQIIKMRWAKILKIVKIRPPLKETLRKFSKP